MVVSRLPDLTSAQVIQLQDALLANADVLLKSALAVLDLGHVALAQSLAILGLEESGKAIAVHNRRVSMGYLPDGEPFRCEELDRLWSSHRKKLETVYAFLVDEPYWFGVEPADPDENAGYLGIIKSWSRRYNAIKERGFYVDLSRTGEVMAPSDIADEDSLREVISRVHQIGWQLRLGEHIEGQLQDEREAGIPPIDEEALDWLAGAAGDKTTKERLTELRKTMTEGVPGDPLPNAEYRFNQPGQERNPFRDVGKPGYEAQTRELMRLAKADDEGEE